MVKAHNRLTTALAYNTERAAEVLTANLNFAAAAEQFKNSLAVAGAPAAKAVSAGTGVKK